MSIERLFWLMGAVVACGGLVLTGWALFWDRARGRRRCPKCWYDLAATPAGAAGTTCPECGRTARSERELARTRRRNWFRK